MVLSSRQVAMLLNRDKSVVNRWAKRHEVPKIDGFYLWTEAKIREYRRTVHESEKIK